MTEHVLAAWSDEVQGRRVNVHETRPGVVYRDAKVTVIAFNAGYRLQTADRRIVIAGDPSASASIVEQCNGCDMLIQEAQIQQRAPGERAGDTGSARVADPARR